MDFDRIDAAVAVGQDKLFFFPGAEYIRLDRHHELRKRGTKDEAKKRWPGITFDKMDTAASGEATRSIFSLKTSIFAMTSVATGQPGLYEVLSSNYVEDWELFD